MKKIFANLTVSLLNPIHRRLLLFVAAFILCLVTVQTGKAVGVNNPGFETGTFSSWTIQATNPTPTISSSIVHSGTKSANVGSPLGIPEANGDSSIYQTVNVPANVDKLSFWYYPRSQDSITFNWQDVYIADTSGNILATVMHNCSNSQTWTNVNFNMAPYAGQTVRIVFLVHSDGFGDNTDMFVDDVDLTTFSTTINNSGFETGSLAPWVIQATNPTPTISSSIVHSGTKSVNIGSPLGLPEANGDSSIYQTFIVPANGGTLSFWYYPRSQDSITFNWQDAYITDTSGNILATIMHICSNSQTWTRVNYNMASFAGQTVRIMFLVHSDGFGDNTDMFVDDVTLIAPTAAGINITGRALTSNGIGISNAVIQLTDSQGNEKSVKTSTLGYYTFEDVPAGQTYVITASAKRYTFEQPIQVLNVSDNLTDVDFIANPF
jgi:hypothetical protein